MKNNKKEDKCNCGYESDSACNCSRLSSCSCGGAFYGLGFIGAAIYYISQANGFWMGVLGFLKAIVWPAFLVFDAFKFLGI